MNPEHEQLNHNEQGFCPHGNESASCERCLTLRQRWEEIAAEVEEIVDALGKPIDVGIKETVIGLQANHIDTDGSCEGHLDRAVPYPWVAVQSPESGRIARQPRFEELRIAERNARRGKGTMEATARAEYQAMLIQKADADARTRQEIERLLQEFYANTDDDESPYRIDFERTESMRLAPRYAEQYRQETEDIPVADRAALNLRYTDQLTAGRDEMRRFTEFLKHKYFSQM